MEDIEMESKKKKGDANQVEKSQLRSSRLILIVLGVMILALSVGVILLGYSLYSESTEGKPKLCLTDECIASADRIVSSMNTSVDPCDNFYEFACGGYVDTNSNYGNGFVNRFNELGDLTSYRVLRIFDEGIIPSMPETVKQAIEYYEKCIDEDTRNKIGVEPMLKHIESLGLPRVPIQDGTAIEPSPWPQLEGNGVDARRAAKELNDLDHRLQTARLVYPSEMNEKLMTVAELQAQSDVNVTSNDPNRFDWSEFLTSYLEESVLKFDIKKDKILVKNPQVIKDTFEVLYNTPPETIELYTWFYYFYSMAPFTTPDLYEAYVATDIYAKLFGGPPRNLKKRCSYFARGLFHNAISHEYLERYFDKERKEKTEVMVHDIHDAFTQLIKGLDWMDEKTKTFALEKVDAVKPNIGYPKWFFVPGALDERNFFIKDVRGDWLTMNINKFVVAFKKHDPYKFKNDTNWLGMSKIEINAFYVPQLVAVYFPAGILQAPFAGNGLASLNYGAIGAVIGHEFTHGFDNKGHKYDKNGEKNNWWSKETKENFDERVQCMIDQYSKFHIPELGPDVKLDGKKTANENIADNGGMREALIAYDLFKSRQVGNEKKGTEKLHDLQPDLPGLANYTHKQLFFLGFANMWCQNPSPAVLNILLKWDVHSPGRERVLGTLSNTKEFADAWNCPAGSKMNPEDKCVVW
ncbi:neprilysin-11-like [Cloeon dipterum]|uniref:neprilysin-11-like n=1 Tax=Cloeon dipterum TaxID=197152 RepID=UPI00321FF02A